MSLILRIWAIFNVAIKRLLSQWGLALVTTLGLASAVTLILSVPLYADAVYYRMFLKELAEVSPVAEVANTPPPLAFTFNYSGATDGPLEWEEVQQVDAYLSTGAESDLGLSQTLLVRYFRTDTWALVPQMEAAYADANEPLAWVTFAFISNLEDYVTLLEGSFPTDASPAPNSVAEVMVSEALALEQGLQVGESYLAFTSRNSQNTTRKTQVPIRLAGIWRPTNAQDPFWFYHPETFEEQLLVSEATFVSRLSPNVNQEIYQGLWHLIMDGSDVESSQVASLVRRITRVRQEVAAYLPDTDLLASPVGALQRYRREARSLTIVLFAFSVPIIGLTLAFISQVVSLSVERQRNATAVMRSRGATVPQLAGMATVEALLLGLVALVIGLLASEWIVQFMGRIRSFLDFSGPSDLRVVMTPGILRFGLAAVGLALAMQVLPTLGPSRQTVVSFKQEQGRVLRKPWWQRTWLDLLLLIPVAYGVYLLQQQGSITFPIVGGAVVGDPYQNPLFFLIPALTTFAVTLVILRILPYLIRVLAWLVARTGSIGLLMAARMLARTPRLYSVPLILLILTLSLSAFTASLAGTLDNNLYDQTYYRIGADLKFPAPMEVEGGSGSGLSPEGPGAITSQEIPPLVFLPVTEYLKAPEVQAVARVGRYEATSQLSGRTRAGTFVGIDRIDFPKVTYWRYDFAPESLGALMNALALQPDGVLLPRAFMRQHALNIGDTIRVKVSVFFDLHELDMKVVGAFDLFPTWYPQDGPLFVGNLEYLFEQTGSQLPYDVWLRTEPNYNQVVASVQNVDPRVRLWEASLMDILAEQQRPERQGLFGLLSVGFTSAALLTILGFLLYILFSFRRRFIELGTLRAIGLSSAQLASFLIWELAFLIVTGMVVGTGLGIWISDLFIPYLQVGGGSAAQIPPAVVEIAWPAIARIYALFGLLFVASLAGLVILLLRMKIFQAIKLGETV